MSAKIFFNIISQFSILFNIIYFHEETSDVEGKVFTLKIGENLDGSSSLSLVTCKIFPFKNIFLNNLHIMSFNFNNFY